MTRVAAHFAVIRARFNKRSTQNSSQAKFSSKYPQRAAPNFDYRRQSLALLESGRFP
jgi:hypothetical protein